MDGQPVFCDQTTRAGFIGHEKANEDQESALQQSCGLHAMVEQTGH
jgi:hypothetical protein